MKPLKMSEKARRWRDVFFRSIDSMSTSFIDFEEITKHANQLIQILTNETTGIILPQMTVFQADCLQSASK